jgi:predicted HAD superfamily Cof-like phosphohydrolase
MNGQQGDVKAFHEACGIPAPSAPAALPADRVALRVRLLREEVQEFADAAESGDLIGSIHELVDVLVVTHGALVELGVDADPFWAEIHAANMRKVGGPMRADGKRLKPPGWRPADVSRVFREVYGSESAA